LVQSRITILDLTDPDFYSTNDEGKSSGATFSKLLRKILERFLILGQSLARSGKTLARHNFTPLTNS